MIEPRQVSMGGPTPFTWRKAAPKRRNGLAWKPPRGRRAGHVLHGSPRNLGGPVVSIQQTRRWEPPHQTPGCPGGVHLPGRSERSGRGVVPRSEGNEAKRDERQVGVDGGSDSGVLVPNSTVEAGTTGPDGTPRRKGGTGYMDPLEGTMKETLSSHLISTQLQRIADLARPAPGFRALLDQRVRDVPSRGEPMHLRNRMRKIRTYGSVGGLGG